MVGFLLLGLQCGDVFLQSVLGERGLGQQLAEIGVGLFACRLTRSEEL